MRSELDDSRPAGRSPRYPSLDGLRGLAALVVVLHHSLLLDPNLANAYRPGHRTHGPAAVLAYSPLHLFWAGGEAVTVFFVLSGLVLVLPYVGDRRPVWPAYYVQRLSRLYLPTLAGLVLAVVIFLVVGRGPYRGESWWSSSHHDVFRKASIVWDAALVAPGRLPGYYNSALWSLRWEVLFSLALPAYLLLARGRATRPAVGACLGAAAVVLAGLGTHVGNAILIFLPVFAVGALLAPHLSRLVDRGGGCIRVTWLGLGVIACLLLTVRWWTPLPSAVGYTGVVVGAALTVVTFVSCRAAVDLGTSRPVAFLGRTSFSLYLVHEPIVVSVGHLAPHAPTVVKLVICVVAAITVATAFFALVEAPAHRFSRRLGRRVTRRLAPAFT